jgi:hypothetical protein
MRNNLDVYGSDYAISAMGIISGNSVSRASVWINGRTIKQDHATGKWYEKKLRIDVLFDEDPLDAIKEAHHQAEIQHKFNMEEAIDLDNVDDRFVELDFLELNGGVWYNAEIHPDHKKVMLKSFTNKLD